MANTPKQVIETLQSKLDGMSLFAEADDAFISGYGYAVKDFARANGLNPNKYGYDK